MSTGAFVPSLEASGRADTRAIGAVSILAVFLLVVLLTETDDATVLWTPDVFAALVSALPAVLIALVLEARTAGGRRMDLDALVASGTRWARQRLAQDRGIGGAPSPCATHRSVPLTAHAAQRPPFRRSAVQRTRSARPTLIRTHRHRALG